MKNICNLSKLMSLVFLVFILFQTSTAVAVILNDNVIIYCGNENFTVSQPMTFSFISIETTTVEFNATSFVISSINPINITLNHLSTNLTSCALGETLLNFSANTTASTVWFNISGFKPTHPYIVLRDNVKIGGVVANSTGYISFTNAVWSDHDFDIKDNSVVGVTVNFKLGVTKIGDIGNSVFSILGVAIIISTILLTVIIVKGYTGEV